MVDFCASCRGLWLDAGEIDQILRVTGATADGDPMLALVRGLQPVKGRRKCLCPRCDRNMRELRIPPAGGGPPLVLDKCPHGHGLWFDNGELRVFLERFEPGSGASKTIEFLIDMLGDAVGGSTP